MVITYGPGAHGIHYRTCALQAKMVDSRQLVCTCRYDPACCAGARWLGKHSADCEPMKVKIND